eukprot:NODE_367_length_10044_cov_0.769432.p4 type:complete len:504 gc:universal NODE_367_length_10044_cov_0.769432:1164-2675(+)
MKINFLTQFDANEVIESMVCTRSAMGLKYKSEWHINNENIGAVGNISILEEVSDFVEQTSCIMGDINGTRMVYKKDTWIAASGDYLDCKGGRPKHAPFQNVKSFINGGMLYGSWGSNGASLYKSGEWISISVVGVADLYLMHSGILIKYENGSVGLYGDSGDIKLSSTALDSVCAYDDRVYSYIGSRVTLYQMEIINKPVYGHISINSRHVRGNRILPEAVFMDMGDALNITITSEFDDFYEISINGAPNVYIVEQVKNSYSGFTTLIQLKVEFNAANVLPGIAISNGVVMLTCTGNCMFRLDTGEPLNLKYGYFSIFTGCPYGSSMQINNGFLSVSYSQLIQFSIVTYPENLQLDEMNSVMVRIQGFGYSKHTFDSLRSSQNSIWESDKKDDNKEFLNISPSSAVSFVCLEGSECADIVYLEAFPNPLQLYFNVTFKSNLINSFCTLESSAVIEVYGIELSHKFGAILSGVSFVVSMVVVLVLSMKKYRSELYKYKNKLHNQ